MNVELLFLLLAVFSLAAIPLRFADGPVVDPDDDDLLPVEATPGDFGDGDPDPDDGEPSEDLDDADGDDDEDEDEDGDEDGDAGDDSLDLSGEFDRATELSGVDTSGGEMSIEDELGLTKAQIREMHAARGRIPVVPNPRPGVPPAAPTSEQLPPASVPHSEKPIDFFADLEPGDGITVEDARVALSQATHDIERRIVSNLNRQQHQKDCERQYDSGLKNELDGYAIFTDRGGKTLTASARREQARMTVDAELAKIGRTNGHWTNDDLRREVAKVARAFYVEDGVAPGATKRKKRQPQTGPPRSGGSTSSPEKRSPKGRAVVDLTDTESTGQAMLKILG